MATTKKKARSAGLPQDPYFKKTLPFEQSGARLEFRVSQDLFSSFDVDVGTRFLLRTLKPSDIADIHSILDLGCGYGPIGLTLRKLAERSTVHLVDRDALAVEYSRQNATLNGLEDVQIYGSLGYDDIVKRDFDLIVSNIPAKAGDEAITYFLEHAEHYLNPQGQVVVVVVTSLEPLVDRVLDAMPNVEIILRRARPGHTVYQYRFTAMSAAPLLDPTGGLERGLYQRGTLQMELDDAELTLETAFAVPEFDGPDYVTEMLVEGILGFDRSRPEHAVVINPGQGYGAVSLWEALRPHTLTLVDRDLLALRYTQRNLIANGCVGDSITLMHQVGFATLPAQPADLIAGVLREDEGQAALTWTINRIAESLAPNGSVVLANSSTTISRLLTALPKPLVVENRKRREGNSLLMLRSLR